MSSFNRQTLLVVLGGEKPPVPDGLRTWPESDEAEEQAVGGVVRSRKWGYNGPRQQELEQRVCSELGVRFAKAITNGGDALQVMYAGMGLPFGARVAMPGFTFYATAEAAVRRNLVPILVDVDENLCLSPAALANVLAGEQHIAAVIVAPMYRSTPDFDAISELCERHRIPLLGGDFAHTIIGAEWQTPGTAPVPIVKKVKVAIGSGQGSKPSQAGELGLLVTDDAELFERASEYQNCGRTDRGAGHRPLMGGNFRPTELACALYLAQLDRREEQFATRERVGEALDHELEMIDGVTVKPRQPRLVSRPQFHYVVRVDERYAPLTGPCIAWALGQQLPWGVRPIYRPLSDPLSGWDPLSDPAIPPQLRDDLDPERYRFSAQLPNAKTAYRQSFVLEQDALLNDAAVEMFPENLGLILAQPQAVFDAWVRAGRPALTH